MERILLLIPSGSFYYLNSMKLPDVVVFLVFREVHGASEMVWKATRKLRLVANSLFYTDWYRDLQSFSKIIVFDSTVWLDPALLRDINRHKNPDAKYYLYSWNIVRDRQVVLDHLATCRKYGFSYYSYDENDRKQHGFRFNAIMYDENLRLPERALMLDTLFLSFLKDHKTRVFALYQITSDVGTRPELVTVENDNQREDLPLTIRHLYINYADYLDMVSQSKTTLDITQQDQNGLSMRVTESIFLNKKFVSINTALLSMNFYDPNNILVVDLRNPDEEELTMFLRSEFHSYSQETRHYYSVGSWINRLQR